MERMLFSCRRATTNKNEWEPWTALPCGTLVACGISIIYSYLWTKLFILFKLVSSKEELVFLCFFCFFFVRRRRKFPSPCASQLKYRAQLMSNPQYHISCKRCSTPTPNAHQNSRPIPTRISHSLVKNTTFPKKYLFVSQMFYNFVAETCRPYQYEHRERKANRFTPRCQGQREKQERKIGWIPV